MARKFGQPLPKAPRQQRSKPATARPPDEDRVDDYRHDAASRLHVPQVGLATQHFDEDGLFPIVTHAFNFVGRGALGLFEAGDGGQLPGEGH